MDPRTEMLTAIYTQGDEDTRLTRSRHGQMEYLTTMHYIHRLIPAGARVLEIGAGTGRYSVALAKEGYQVTAVELVRHNLAVLRKNAAGLENLTALQGDALDLSRFDGGSFDAVLLFGPMYHLYDAADVHRALDEAVRVARPGGVLMTAFLSVYAIMHNCYLNEGFPDGLAENFTDSFAVRHFQEQMFTGYDIAAFENLFAAKPVTHLTTVAADGALELAAVNPDFCLPDEAFEHYVRYHLAFCEKRELLGASSHLLHICRKQPE